jgi:hypothetical protein
MSAFYFSSTDVTNLGLVFKTLTYTIRIAENPSLFATPVNCDYILKNTGMWLEQTDKTLSREYVRRYILNTIIGGTNGLEANNGISYTTGTADTTVLNSAGRTLVISAIPYLDTPIPQLFQLSVQQISVAQPTTGVVNLQTGLTLQNQLGTQISTAFTNFGSLLHVSGQQVALGWMMICILILISIVFLATGNLIGASICSLPMVLVGVWIGAIPVAFIFTGVMVIVVLLAFYLFIRGM